ncbi:hypothetical protein HYS91_03285 [Candidatus Daviesbacteria bacterium]|nr:hypothetical protein [Candidatus Daviesbacteria bacterium]
MVNRLSAKSFVLSQLGILIVSLVFLGTLYYFLNQDNFLKSAIEDYLPVTTRPLSFTLDLNSPEDELLTFEKTILIAGKTSPFSTVIITSSNNDVGLEANSQGEFSNSFELTEGLNLITVASFDKDGNAKSLTRSIYYSKEEI